MSVLCYRLKLRTKIIEIQVFINIPLTLLIKIPLLTVIENNLLTKTVWTDVLY